MRKKTMFFVVGRLGETLVHQKVKPFIETGLFNNCIIFRESEGIEIDNVTYITIPPVFKKIKIIKLRNLSIRIYEPIQLLFYTLKKKPDYINGIYTLPKGLNAVIVGLLTGTKSIVSVIGNTIEIDTYYKWKFFWKNLNIWMLNKTNIVTTTGLAVTNYAISLGIAEEKIFEFPGFVDTDRFYLEKNNEKNIDILFVGTFRKLKGPDKIVKMIKKLLKQFPNIKAHFLGKGYLFDEVQDMIINLGLQKNIILEGYKSDTPTFFQRAKILVMPSRSEGLSMAMLEAMACGCVPVVSNVGNMTEAAHHGINSFVVEDYIDFVCAI